MPVRLQGQGSESGPRLGVCCPSPGWVEKYSGQGGLHVVQSWNQALSSRQIRARGNTLVVEPPSELPKLSPTQISLRVQIWWRP